MLKMRLQRTGRKNDPSFRVVVTDSRHGPKSGKHADTIGSYSPKFNRIEIDGARAKDWFAMGVQAWVIVINFLIAQGTLQPKKRQPQRKLPQQHSFTKNLHSWRFFVSTRQAKKDTRGACRVKKGQRTLKRELVLLRKPVGDAEIRPGGVPRHFLNDVEKRRKFHRLLFAEQFNLEQRVRQTSVGEHVKFEILVAVHKARPLFYNRVSTRILACKKFEILPFRNSTLHFYRFTAHPCGLFGGVVIEERRILAS